MSECEETYANPEQLLWENFYPRGHLPSALINGIAEFQANWKYDKLVPKIYSCLQQPFFSHIGIEVCVENTCKNVPMQV